MPCLVNQSGCENSLSYVILFIICNGEMGRAFHAAPRSVLNKMKTAKSMQRETATENKVSHQPHLSLALSPSQSSFSLPGKCNMLTSSVSVPRYFFLSGQYLPQLVNTSSITSSGIIPCFFSQASKSLGHQDS